MQGLTKFIILFKKLFIPSAALHLHSWTDYFRSKANYGPLTKKPWMVWHDMDEGVLDIFSEWDQLFSDPVFILPCHMDPFLAPGMRKKIESMKGEVEKMKAQEAG